MSKSWPFKDPLEVLDYGWNWLPRFLKPGETTTTDSILTIVASVLSGSVVVNSSNVNLNSFVTTTWLSGGTLEEECSIRLLITTAQNRTLEQTVKIKIKDR